MLDISDGLGLDAGRLATASGLAIELDAAAIPLADPASAVIDAVAAGEDYELLFAVSPSRQLPPTCPATGTPITRIGLATLPTAMAATCTLRLPDGAAADISTRGWEHH
jgi:thiamine-monophosphate kinase